MLDAGLMAAALLQSTGGIMDKNASTSSNPFHSLEEGSKDYIFQQLIRLVGLSNSGLSTNPAVFAILI